MLLLTFFSAANNVRLVATFVRENARTVPEGALKSLMKSARKSYESVRRDWLQMVTKIKE